jgi:hypothetical protein
MSTNDSWGDAYRELERRIQEHPAFMRVVKSYGGHPRAAVPTRRCARLSRQLCEQLGLDPGIWLGNVFGAAAHYIEVHA